MSTFLKASRNASIPKVFRTIAATLMIVILLVYTLVLQYLLAVVERFAVG